MWWWDVNMVCGHMKDVVMLCEILWCGMVSDVAESRMWCAMKCGSAMWNVMQVLICVMWSRVEECGGVMARCGGAMWNMVVLCRPWCGVRCGQLMCSVVVWCGLLYDGVRCNGMKSDVWNGAWCSAIWDVVVHHVVVVECYRHVVV